MTIIAASGEQVMSDVKEMLKAKFKMKDLGNLSHFLGIHFDQKEGVVTMNQRKYLCKLLEKFDMSECNLRATLSEQ